MNVLIVDDQPRISRVTAAAFEALGCQPFTAASTAEADRTLAAERIDALFLDVNLGGECGWSFLADVRARADAPLVVMFSALTREEFADEAIRHGAFDCLVKPFGLNELREQIARIRQHLQQHPRPPRSP